MSLSPAVAACLTALALLGAPVASGLPPGGPSRPPEASEATPQDTAPAPDWEAKLPSRPTAPPVALEVGNEPLVLVALEGRIEVRRARDGALAWSLETPPGSRLAVSRPSREERAPGASPVIGLAAPTGEGGRFELLGAADGHVIAGADLPVTPTGPPLPPAEPGRPWLVPLGDSLAVVDDQGEVYPGPRFDAPIVAPLLRVAGEPAAVLEDGRLHPVTRRVSRRTARHVAPDAAVSVNDDLYSAGNRQLRAWRCRVTRGDRLRCREDWSQPLGATVTAPPAVSGPRVFVGSWDTFLYAFDADTGHLLWRQRVEYRLRTGLIVDSGSIVVGIREPAGLRTFAADTGQPSGRIDLPRGEVLPHGPALAGRRLITASIQALDGTAWLRAWPWRAGSTNEGEPPQSSPRSAERNRDSISR